MWRKIGDLLASTLVALSLLSGHAHAQAPVVPYIGVTPNPVGGQVYAPVSSTNPLPISGSITASLGAFAPGGSYATLSVTNSSGNVALPTGVAIVVYNTGTNNAFVKLGTSNAVTATTSEDVVSPGCYSSYTVGSNTYLAAITASSTTSLIISGGSGLAAAGCSPNVTISGAAVYGPTAAASPAANPPVIIGGTVDGTATGNVDNWKVASGVGFVSAVVPSGGIASGAVASGAIASGAFASGAVGSGAFASGAIGSGAIASGAVASGAFASGAIASGAIASGAVASGAFTSGSISDGASVTLGTKADAKSTATDTTAITLMQVQKEISFQAQAIAASAATIATNTGAAVPAGTNCIGQTAAGPSGCAGWSMKWFVAANSDNATNLKNAAGIVHAVEVYGIDASPAYLKFYNKASSPTCASDTIVKQIMIPAASTAANGAGANVAVLDVAFSTGISYCVVKGIGATDDTSVDAASYVVNIDYN